VIDRGSRENPRPPRFLADAMLARLARWLRVLGFDTAFDPALPDRELVALAAAEDRVLLTRDRHLVEHLRPARALLIRSDAPLAQLRDTIEAFHLERPAELFRRCLVCNTELVAVPPDEAADRIPPGARVFSDDVRCCPTCGRLYWSGSHTRRMRAALARALPSWFPESTS
jgi:uncharacterized protein with PIN domain